MPNADLAWQVYDLIEKYPAKLDMSNWIRDLGVLYPEQCPSPSAYTRQFEIPIALDDFTGRCNTTACYAGWTVLAAGYQTTLDARVYDEEGTKLFRSVQSVAMHLLDIDDDQRALLFTETSEDELEDAITAIFGPRPVGAVTQALAA